MLTENQKQVVTDFFKYSKCYGSVRGMWVKREVLNLGKITSMTKTEDNGFIKIKGNERIKVTEIKEPGLSSLIAFMKEIHDIRETIQKTCQEALPANKKFIILFDNETPKSTRFIFQNENELANYQAEYAIIKKKLELLGYKVELGYYGSVADFYITKYKTEYLSKSFMERFLYDISHIA